MGTNNRQRRAAKQKKRARERVGRPPVTPPGPAFDDWSAYDRVDLEVTAAVRRIAKRPSDWPGLLQRAEILARRVAPAPWPVLQSVVGDLIARIVDDVVAGGWPPGDLAQLIARSGEPRHLPTLLTALYDESRRNHSRGASWLAALEALGADPRVRIDSPTELASGLLVAAVLSTAPLLDTTTVGPGVDDVAPHPKLARVRALLAKAESTQFDEEAEALSAKAQELITRYALGRLVDGGAGHDAHAGAAVRRIWLDAPYVRAKADLVHEVASANHARAALCESHGFSVVVGAAHDLEATELLVTSLLVQANRAMLRHGRIRRGDGTSQTRSFRQAFLVAYARRIGERLQEANDAVLGEDGGRHLPVVRDHDARATAAFEAMVPHTVGRSTSVSNAEGYVAGLAAADLALLDTSGRIEGQTG